MKIKSYGHSAFKLTTGSGVNIIIDPYESGGFGGALSYGPITDEADLVLITHDHGDHNHTAGIKGSFTEVRAEGVHDLKGVRISALQVYHDGSRGKERGKNLVFVIEAEGLKLVHVGDLGHLLDGDVLSRVAGADLLMLPVGGTYTITAAEATEVMNAVKPRITVPMHYKTAKTTFPLVPVEEFTKGKKRVRKAGASEIEIKVQALPEEPEIVVLDAAN